MRRFPIFEDSYAGAGIAIVAKSVSVTVLKTANPVICRWLVRAFRDSMYASLVTIADWFYCRNSRSRFRKRRMVRYRFSFANVGRIRI